MRVLVSLLVCAFALAGQGFEAASIKPAKPAGSPAGGMQFLPGGRFRAGNMPMLIILGTAFNVPYSTPDTLRIKNVPDWVITQRYDVEATPEKPSDPSADARSRNEKIRMMLQAVLADRLKLRIHREMIEGPVYALVVGPHGPRLEKSKVAPESCAENAPTGGGAGCHQFRGGMGRGLHGEAVDLADTALYASNWSDRPILDETGLSGLFNVQTEPWGDPVLNDPSRASLREIFERLGLELKPKRAPVEFFVIDHVEKPSEN